ncbi:MAG: dTMP kinase [Proteobacteria bacterium]|jgi:dTMP kinase|nr:dTMP kinase [Pseudomonadota bacterium]
MSPQAGIFISVEGSDGAGKGSNIEFIQHWFKSRLRQVVTTREPGGTPLGEKVRELLLAKNSAAISPMTELLLMFAARSQHIEDVIKPALSGSRVVLCDRFTDASFAYQGGGRGLANEQIEQLKRLVQGDLQPDLTLLLDIPIDVGLTRVSNRGKPDRFDSEADEFKTRVRAAYLQLAENDPARLVIINADQPLKAVQRDIESVLESRFP